MRTTLNEIAEEFIRLCFEIEKHSPGYVDSYFGPPELRTLVERAPKREAVSIAESAAELRAALVSCDADLARQAFLEKQLLSLETSAAILSGKRLPYLEEVARIYDIKPRRVHESRYDGALRAIDELLPGSGSLADRLERYREQLVIPPGLVLEVFKEALDFTRERTAALFDLPSGESFEMSLVTGKPWSGYNWFKGGAKSLIEINIDLPRRIDHVIHLMSHEGYPGHHTDASTKEKVLFREKGCLEYSVHPLFSPQSVIAEGIAELAEEMICSRAEVVDYLRTRVAPKIGLRDFDSELFERLSVELGRIRSVASNSSILLFQEGTSEEEVYEYLRTYGLLDSGYARKRIEFMKKYRGYIFTYNYGYELLREHLSTRNQRAEFQRILREPCIPSQFEPTTEK